MKKKIFTLFLALVASAGIASAAITVRLDPSSCSSWSTVRLWAWTDQGDLFNSWPGQIVSLDTDGWYSYTFDESITSVNIIWNNGFDQTVNIEGVISSTCYALNSTSGRSIDVSVVDCSSGFPVDDIDYIHIQIDDLYYNLDAINQTAEVTYGENNYSGLTAATIPASVTFHSVSYSVTSIGGSAFAYCSSLTSVTIPNNVTSIGDYAFRGCSGLTSVMIPNSVTSIGKYAFSDCSGLTSVTIGNSVTSIGNYAFDACTGLTSVTIPNSVTRIGTNAFFGCSSLTSINVVTDNPNYCSVEGVLFNKDKTVLVQYPGGKEGDYTIPNSVTSIGNYAFYGCRGLTSVTIGNSVTSIGDYAFDACSGLTSVTIPNSVTSLGENAFYGCSSLTSVTIPNSVTSIRWSAFYGCSSLTSVTIPNSVTSIEEYAFEGCSSLTSVTIPNSVTSIGDYAFENCSGLISVTIGNSVTSIGKKAFEYCTGLKNVFIGSAVKVLEESAFYRCSAIETITCYGQRPPTVNQNALYGLDYSTIVYVPADYLNTYKMHDAWGLYDVRPISASKTETTEVKVEPTATTADVVWPAVENAATYELVIKDKSGNVICTLVFNANGQLTQIAFGAPARNNAPQQTQAAGFSFTVTGLEEGTSYDLTITSKDNNGGTLDTKTVSFTTTGESAPTSIEDVQGNNVQCTKVVRNGQIFILRGDKTYTVTGQEIK